MADFLLVLILVAFAIAIFLLLLTAIVALIVHIYETLDDAGFVDYIRERREKRRDNG